MKDSYLLCQERAFISHLNYQVLKKNLKHSSHEQYLKDQWPAIVLEKKLLVFLFICIVFLWWSGVIHSGSVPERDAKLAN